jgi:hypothetical protein
MDTATETSEWTTAADAWADFVKHHPELGYRPGRWQFHNFLRNFRQTLRDRDAIRLAKGKHWIAHRARFKAAAFDCATGAAAAPLAAVGARP